MANVKSAQKRARQAEKRRKLNASQRSMARTHIKRVLKQVRENNWEKAMEEFRLAQKVIDRVTNKNVFTKNWAARTKSRLNARVKALKA